MEFFRIKKSLPFMRHAKIFNAISFATFLLAVFFLFSRGLHLSIEFEGGMVMEVSSANHAEPGLIREALKNDGLLDISVITFGSANDVQIRLPLKMVNGAQNQNEAMQTQSDRVMALLKKMDASATLKQTQVIGSTVGKELAYDGALALSAVCIGIMLYLAIRFEWRFAVATIIANLHDVVIILGFFAFFQWEFSLPVLAAVLAILGYSVNESVVEIGRASCRERVYSSV